MREVKGYYIGVLLVKLVYRQWETLGVAAAATNTRKRESLLVLVVLAVVLSVVLAMVLAVVLALALLLLVVSSPGVQELGLGVEELDTKGAADESLGGGKAILKDVADRGGEHTRGGGREQQKRSGDLLDLHVDGG